MSREDVKVLMRRCQADVIGWYRHRIVPQAVAGTKRAFLSETGLGQMSQTDAVIGQVA